MRIVFINDKSIDWNDYSMKFTMLVICLVTSTHTYALNTASDHLNERSYVFNDTNPPLSNLSLNKLIQKQEQLLLGADEFEKVEAINGFLNKNIAYQTDLLVWGQADYWATPKELLQKGAGDCEDFAIAKYYYLIKLGVPQEKLRLGYFHLRPSQVSHKYSAHMALIYYPTTHSPPLVLDNVSEEIIALTNRSDLRLIFSFNDAGIRLTSNGQVRYYSNKRYVKWQNILNKLLAQ